MSLEMHAADLLSTRAHLTPDRVALVELHTGQRYTYAELNARASRIANALRGLGVEQGDRVSILAQNSVVYSDLLFGLAKVGAIFTPLNWRLVARELAYIVNDAAPKVLIVGPEYTSVLAAMRPEIDVPHILSLEGAAIEGAPAYEDLLAAASEAEPPRPPLAAEDTLAILYTSGTTGRPKGALIPHRQVLWNCVNTAVSWGLTETDVAPIFTPMFHAGGLFIFLTPLVYLGGRVVVARSFDTDATLRAIQDEGCTAVLGVPTLFQMWRNSPIFPEVDLSRVRFFISGGAPCPPALIESWREAKGVPFRQGYGLTEVGVNCFTMTDDEAARKIGSVGKPIFHSKMRLVDSDGQDVAVGEPGELWIWGPHVCTGYWRNPDATREALRDGWFRTGDIARMDADGCYTIIGRAKDMIISGGENVYAAEVETVFRQHAAVQDAALIGMPDEQWGEVGLMIVVLRPGRSVSEAALKQFCEGRLARYKIPKKIVFAEALPYSPYGKVVKADLRKQYLGE